MCSAEGSSRHDCQKVKLFESAHILILCLNQLYICINFIFWPKLSNIIWRRRQIKFWRTFTKLFNQLHIFGKHKSSLNNFMNGTTISAVFSIDKSVLLVEKYNMDKRGRSIKADHWLLFWLKSTIWMEEEGPLKVTIVRTKLRPFRFLAPPRQYLAEEI